MELQSILMAGAILGGVGLAFGALIALANRRFHVDEDPRVDAVTEMLPGSNCGACGQAGCRAFAEALVQGAVEPAGCTVMGPADREDVAAFLGVDAGEAVKRVARLLCAGGSDVAPRRRSTTGCRAARPRSRSAVAGRGAPGGAWGSPTAPSPATSTRSG
jgi:Na+-translocating ferredoxin:NAD+ oxidoreductase subunit B